MFIFHRITLKQSHHQKIHCFVRCISNCNRKKLPLSGASEASFTWISMVSVSWTNRANNWFGHASIRIQKTTEGHSSANLCTFQVISNERCCIYQGQLSWKEPAFVSLFARLVCRRCFTWSTYNSNFPVNCPSLLLRKSRAVNRLLKIWAVILNTGAWACPYWRGIRFCITISPMRFFRTLSGLTATISSAR